MPDPSQFNTDRTTLVPMWRDCCSRFFPSASRKHNVVPAKVNHRRFKRTTQDPFGLGRGRGEACSVSPPC